MAVSAKKMNDVLRRMAYLFRPPLNLLQEGATDEAARLWAGVLGEDFDDESIAAAALLLARTQRRFPVPADFLEIPAEFLATAQENAKAKTDTVSRTP